MRSAIDQMRETSLCPEIAYRRLEQIRVIYPDFAFWFWRTCAPGLLIGSRRIFSVQSDNECAIVIAKKSSEERKLCTIFVSKGFQNRGIATRLIWSALHWLECRKPILTISDERMAEFRPILSRFDFSRPKSVDSVLSLRRPRIRL